MSHWSLQKHHSTGLCGRPQHSREGLQQETVRVLNSQLQVLQQQTRSTVVVRIIKMKRCHTPSHSHPAWGQSQQQRQLQRQTLAMKPTLMSQSRSTPISLRGTGHQQQQAGMNAAHHVSSSYNEYEIRPLDSALLPWGVRSQTTLALAFTEAPVAVGHITGAVAHSELCAVMDRTSA